MSDTTEDATTKLRHTLDHFRAAVNSGDGTAVYDITADDFELMAPGQPAVNGEAARGFLSSLVTEFDADLKPFSNEQLIVCGDYAIQRYSFDLTLTPKSGGAPMAQRGDGLHIFPTRFVGALAIGEGRVHQRGSRTGRSLGDVGLAGLTFR